ncbi:Hypothetical predicted protein [Mytilus galloprovincialis]|uniref:DDE Tnp4 domain-containing protein n=1 Tax=Mytilus galloprovincialis TaxID=29158 RepID=A0A8B6CR61_MYTGA|nr:Hypothetical predicted protein [Mytilus galloprovincialis]
MHKHRPLVKPMVFVTTSGYIVSVMGPYMGDGKNNDANIMTHIIKRNIEKITDWLQEDDILIVDRGFRDSLDLLNELGIKSEMPSFLGRGEKQHSVEESNTTRLVTKLRWIVESINDYACSKIIAGGAVTFAAIIIFLVGIIVIQRRKLTNASYTSLTVRRDQNNYNEAVPHEMSDSITGQYYEMSSVSETHAPTVQQNINKIQHIDTSGYLIPSGMLETSGDYHTITD